MKRLALLITLIALTVGSVDAQFRVRRRPYVAPASAVTITVPTGNPTFVAASTPLTVEGTSSGAVTQVTWSNDRGGSGTATGVGAWTIEASGGSATVFQDTATCPSTTAITSMVPSIGTSWTESVDSAGTNIVNCRTSGYFQPSTSATGERLIYTTTPTASAGTDYDLSASIALTGGSGSTFAVIYAYTDANNYCGIKIYNSSTATDTVWFKWVAGVSTTLTSFSMDAITNDTILLEVRDTVGTLYKNGAQVGTATDAVCNDTKTVGWGWGAVNGVGTDAISTSTRLDNLTVVDHAGSSGGIVLQTGTNVITVTGKNAGGSTVATDVLTVTYGASDTTPPGIVIDNPTVNPTHFTATAALTVSGTATDNVGDIAVTWACAECSGATSGSATGEVPGISTTWTLSLTLTCSAAPGTANTIIVTATDTATNTGTDQLVATCTSSDVTGPVVTITTDCGSGVGVDCTVATLTQTLGGTATDAGGVSSVQCECSTCTPPVVSATGPSPWACTVDLAVGANLVTVRALDTSNNPGTDTITVTRSQALTITTATPLGTVTEDVAMPTKVIQATGGTAPYTWTIDGTPTTLNDGDAECAGTAWADVGNDFNATGTPTTVGTCTFTVRVTDNVAATTTKAYTFVVAVAGTGPHAFFEAGIQRADFWKALSFRPTSAGCTDTHAGKSFAGGSVTEGTCNPFLSTQLSAGSSGGGYRNTNSGTLLSPEEFIAYDSTYEAAKVDIEAFVQRPSTALSATLTVGATIMTIGNDLSWGAWVNEAGYLIENEIMVCDAIVGFDPELPTKPRCRRRTAGVGSPVEVRILRGQYGTTAVEHTSGTNVQVAANSIDVAKQIRFPMWTTNGSTYVITWDQLFTESYHMPQGAGSNQGNKMIQFSGPGKTDGDADSIFLEVKQAFRGSTQPIDVCPGWDPAVHVMAFSMRSYNNPYTGAASWAESDSDSLGPNATKIYPITPMNNAMCIFPNRWVRFWLVNQQVANGYDLMTLWMADEQREAVKLYDAIQTSIPPWVSARQPTRADQLHKFWVEFNDSEQAHARGSVNPFRDLTSYIRNLLILRDPPGADYATSGSGLLIKPLPVQ